MSYCKIREASHILGVSIDTLRRWDEGGIFRPDRSPGGTRLYDKETLIRMSERKMNTDKELIIKITNVLEKVKWENLTIGEAVVKILEALPDGKSN